MEYFGEKKKWESKSWNELSGPLAFQTRTFWSRHLYRLILALTFSLGWDKTSWKVVLYVLCIQCILNILGMIIIAEVLVYPSEKGKKLIYTGFWILFFLFRDEKNTKVPEDIANQLKKEDMAIWLKKEWKRGEVTAHITWKLPKFIKASFCPYDF